MFFNFDSSSNFKNFSVHCKIEIVNNLGEVINVLHLLYDVCFGNTDFHLNK